MNYPPIYDQVRAEFPESPTGLSTFIAHLDVQHPIDHLGIRVTIDRIQITSTGELIAALPTGRVGIVAGAVHPSGSSPSVMMRPTSSGSATAMWVVSAGGGPAVLQESGGIHRTVTPTCMRPCTCLHQNQFSAAAGKSSVAPQVRSVRRSSAAVVASRPES